MHPLALAILAAALQKPAFFTTPLTLEEMKGKQAVVETGRGSFVIALLPEVAPNHVGYFIKLAREGAYDGTLFHRVIRHGIIQGGDPLTKDPARADRYGTGGLGVLKAEINPEKHTRGAVSAVLLPGKPDSAGSQFFVAVTDLPQLDGNYTVFGRVVEGMEIVQAISEVPLQNERPVERVSIRSVTVRDAPPEEPAPFSTETVDELASYRAILETSFGPITLEFFPDKAPAHVRNFLRLASLGAYDGTAFHRIVPGFVIQTGFLPTRSRPLPQKAEKHVTQLPPEFNDTPHLKGIVSMARGDDPASGSTSFFICTAPAPSLDGKYTAFGRVVDGLRVVEAIEAVPTDGDKPLGRVELARVRIERAR